jgi:hypothetical protein
MNFIIEVPVNIEWFLVLNPIRGRTEDRSTFGPFDSKEVATNYYKALRVAQYEEPGLSPWGPHETMWRKCFAAGSELEWMNAVDDETFTTRGRFGHGVHEEVKIIGDIISRKPVLSGEYVQIT